MPGTVDLGGNQGLPDRLPRTFRVGTQYPDSIGRVALVDVDNAEGGTGQVPALHAFSFVPDPGNLPLVFPTVDILLFCQDVPAIAKGISYIPADAALVTDPVALQISIDGGTSFIGNQAGGLFDDGLQTVGQPASVTPGSDPASNLLSNPSPALLQAAQAVQGNTVTNNVNVAGQPIVYQPIARGLYTQGGAPADSAYFLEFHTQDSAGYGFSTGGYGTDAQNTAALAAYTDVIVPEDAYTAAMAAAGNQFSATVGDVQFFTRIVGIWRERVAQP